MNRDAFLAYVKSYIESDPEAAAYVAHSVQAGLGVRLLQRKETTWKN